MMVTSPLLTRQQRGVLAVVGAFLLQLVAGSYNGTFGNLLPYLTSFLRQVGQGDLRTQEMTRQYLCVQQRPQTYSRFSQTLLRRRPMTTLQVIPT